IRRRCCPMDTFNRRAPLELTTFPEPKEDDRSGPALTQGPLFTLIRMVAAEDCSPEALAALDKIDPAAWYHGQLLETILNELEDRDPTLPQTVGRNVYFMFRAEFEKLGMRSARSVIESLPFVWKAATRGGSGEWRTRMLGPSSAS